MRECAFKLLCGMRTDMLCRIPRSRVLSLHRPGGCSLAHWEMTCFPAGGVRRRAAVATSGEEPAGQHAEGATVIFLSFAMNEATL